MIRGSIRTKSSCPEIEEGVNGNKIKEGKNDGDPGGNMKLERSAGEK